MEPRDRVFGPIAVHDDNGATTTVDFGDLVRKLVLFEEVVLESNRLKEFPLLIAKFGYDGLRELLESRRLRIDCEATAVGETGRTTELLSRERKGALPLGSYAFSVIQLTDRKQYIHDSLQPIDDARGLRGRQGQKLRKLVAESIATPPTNSGFRGAAILNKHLASNAPVLKTSIAFVVARELQKAIEPNDFEFRVERLDEQDFRTETTLGELIGVDEETLHKLVAQGLLGVGGLGRRIELMERYEAVTGFQRAELPLVGAELNFLARQLDPDVQVERFQRVLDLTGLPDASPDPDVKDVDMGRLLEIVQSDEICAFRAWVRALDSLDDEQVKHEIHKIRERARHAIDSSAGKTVRLLATTGLGIALPPAGFAAGAAI